MRRRSRAGGEPLKARRRKTATLKRRTAPKVVRSRDFSKCFKLSQVLAVSWSRRSTAAGSGERRASTSSAAAYPFRRDPPLRYLHLPCLGAPLRLEDSASDRGPRAPRREPRCEICGSAIARRDSEGRSQMRPAQARSARKSNWSNPKSYELFCSIFRHSRVGRAQRPRPRSSRRAAASPAGWRVRRDAPASSRVSKFAAARRPGSSSK